MITRWQVASVWQNARCRWTQEHSGTRAKWIDYVAIEMPSGLVRVGKYTGSYMHWGRSSGHVGLRADGELKPTDWRQTGECTITTVAFCVLLVLCVKMFGAPYSTMTAMSSLNISLWQVAPFICGHAFFFPWLPVVTLNAGCLLIIRPQVLFTFYCLFDS